MPLPRLLQSLRTPSRRVRPPIHKVGPAPAVAQALILLMLLAPISTATTVTFQISALANLYHYTNPGIFDTNASVPVLVPQAQIAAGQTIQVSITGGRAHMSGGPSCDPPGGLLNNVLLGLPASSVIGRWSTSPTILDNLLLRAPLSILEAGRPLRPHTVLALIISSWVSMTMDFLTIREYTPRRPPGVSRPPPPASRPTQVGYNGTQIQLTWDYGSDPIDGFHVDRKTPLGAWPTSPTPVSLDHLHVH